MQAEEKRGLCSPIEKVVNWVHKMQESRNCNSSSSLNSPSDVFRRYSKAPRKTVLDAEYDALVTTLCNVNAPSGKNRRPHTLSATTSYVIEVGNECQMTGTH